jgi:hypothetical protein
MNKFKFQVHGNYVGPGWSAGEWQDSVAYSDVQPIDEFDDTGRRHDKAYRLHASKSDAATDIRDNPKYLNEADEEFALWNIQGISHNDPLYAKRLFSGYAIQAQKRRRIDTWSGKDLIVLEGPAGLPEKVMPVRHAARRTARRAYGGRTRTVRRSTPRSRRPAAPRRRTARRGRQHFRRRRTGKSGKRFTPAYTMKVENGGQLVSLIASSGYVGHSFGIQQAHIGVIATIIKALISKAGITFTNWRALMNDVLSVYSAAQTYTFRFAWRANQSATSVSTSDIAHNGSLTDTVFTFIDRVVAKLDTDMGLLSGSTPELIYCTLVETTQDGVNNIYNILSRLDLLNFQVHFNMSSRLVLQNTTLSGGAQVVDQELVTDIYKNPIEGYRYVSKNNTNGFRMKQQNDNSVTTQYSLFGQKFTGIIAIGPAIINSATNNSEIIAKPPSARTLGARRADRLQISAGGLVKDLLHYKHSFMLGDFFTRYRDVLVSYAAFADNDDSRFGRAHMFGLTAMLNSRINEPTSLKLDYQVSQTLSVSYSMKKSFPAPIIQVN